MGNYIFWFAVVLLGHSYVLYPALLKYLSRGKKLQEKSESNDLPIVSVLMAVYNEEKVIRAKLESIFNSNYPSDKIELVVGSDGSTDMTDAVIQEFIDRGHSIQFTSFGGRTGKSGIINQIYSKARGSVFIPTDANILFSADMVSKLVRHFENERIGLVGANILNTGMKKQGISFQEEAYIQRENLIKYREGVVWGCMMGAFGACYAIRAKLFPVIPDNFLMEDFYITMSVIDNGYYSICDLSAEAEEDVSDQLKEEFKRKIRISAGNYQNLNVFGHMLWPVWRPIGFAFFSHKLIRWIGPFLLIIALASNIVIWKQNLFYTLTLVIQIFIWLSPLIDQLLKRLNIHTFGLRLIAYFMSMNIALLVGLVKYLRGVRTSAWSPTKRNVE